MTSRSSSALRKSAARKSQAKPAAKKSVTKSKASNKTASKAGNKTGKLPEWNLADLYSGIGAPEVTRDLQRMDSECVAFETDYKGKLAERTAADGGGKWLAEAVRDRKSVV